MALALNNWMHNRFQGNRTHNTHAKAVKRNVASKVNNIIHIPTTII